MGDLTPLRLGAIGALLLLSSLGLTACEEPPQPVEQIRALKTITVTNVASGQVRKFSGIVQATDTSSLSFQVGGNVQEVKVELGDPVERGQILASLDKKPYELNLQGAQAELDRARAKLEEAKVEFERQDTLYRKGWVAKAAFDQALAAHESAKSEVQYAQSRVNLARRDLDLTELVAPFDGLIAEREVDPFVEVSAGEKLFEINASGALEVALDIPETVIRKVTLGAPVTATFPTERDLTLEGRVTEIGSVAADANAFPVKAGLANPPPELRPGMTAEVTFTFRSDDESTGYLVPLAAIAPGNESRQGYVFVYDPESSTVRKTKVRGRDVRDNLIEIYEGLKAGDVIAVAGVSFLYDGQKVRLMAP